MIRTLAALGAACALLCAPMAAMAQQVDDGAYNAAGTYRQTQPTEQLNPACPNAGGTGVAATGVAGKTYGGVVCPAPASSGPYGGMSATLLSAVNAATTGAAVPHVYKDSYLFSCVATSWGSATAALQFLGPDVTTWLPFSPAVSLTANGSVGVGIGANASIRAVVTGTPTNLTCGIS